MSTARLFHLRVKRRSDRKSKLKHVVREMCGKLNIINLLLIDQLKIQERSSVVKSS